MVMKWMGELYFKYRRAISGFRQERFDVARWTPMRDGWTPTEYRSGWWLGLRELFTWKQSILKHSIPHLGLVAVINVIVYVVAEETAWTPGYQIVDRNAILPFRYFAATAGIAIVFRVNMCYHRWWGARNDLEQMSSYFYSTFMMAVCFDSFTDEEFYKKKAEQREMRKVAETLDKDDLDSEEDEIDDDLALKRALFEFRMKIMSLISLLHANAIFNLSCSKPAPDTTTLERIPARWLTEFHPPGAKHSERWLDEFWFNKDERVEYNDENGRRASIKTEELKGCVSHTAARFDPLLWVYLLLSEQFMNHKVEAPIISRMYQLLSTGMLCFHKALAVKNTPFPFPLVQIIHLMMIVICVLAPCLMRAFELDFFLALFSSWMLTYGFICLAELSSELEMPFGDDENDHPLLMYQVLFDSALEEIARDFSFQPPAVNEDICKTRFSHLPEINENENNYTGRSSECEVRSTRREILSQLHRQTSMNSENRWTTGELKAMFFKDHYDTPDKRASRSSIRPLTRSTTMGFSTPPRRKTIPIGQGKFRRAKSSPSLSPEPSLGRGSKFPRLNVSRKFNGAGSTKFNNYIFKKDE